MCTIRTTHMLSHYPGVRQVICRRERYEGEDTMDPPERGSHFPPIPVETRYFLMLFLMAPSWSLACDILADHPSLLAPWASSFLSNVVLEEHLTAADCDMLYVHIFVLELAQTLGVEYTRAFLHHHG